MAVIIKMMRRAMLWLGYKAYRVDAFGRRRWIEETLSWSQEQRTTWRLERLNEILRFSWEEVEFYRTYWGDHGLSFKPLRSLEDLQAYPVTPKSLFREHCHKFRPKKLAAIRHQEKWTGGTTGEPVHYLQDLDQQSLIQAFHWYGWSLAGYEIGDPVGVIAGGSVVPEAATWKARLRLFLERRCFLFAVNMDGQTAIKYHQKLLKHKSQFLYGYPSVLFTFSKILAQHHLRLPALRAVITTSENLFPYYRETIQRHLGCQVFDDYGCNDGGIQSYECSRHNGLHYNDLQCVAEVRDAATHASGPLLITNLWNRSTPFIRYENGDSIALTERLCPCGSAFPLIGSVAGRTYDILSFRNGATVSGSIIVHIMGLLEADPQTRSGIEGFQGVQTSSNTLEIRVRAPHELNPQAKKYIMSIFERYLGPEVQVVIRRVEALDFTRAGKLKPIWSEIS